MHVGRSEKGGEKRKMREKKSEVVEGSGKGRVGVKGEMGKSTVEKSEKMMTET